MTDGTEDISGTAMEQIKIILNTLYLCTEYAIKHVAEREGAQSAAELKESMLESLKNGDINMALLEETKTFDLVISKIEALALPEV